MMDKEKMIRFMIDTCCKDMSEDRRKMKDTCKVLAGKLPSCCREIDFSSFMKQFFTEPEAKKERA